jgi:hypothetical protein
VTLPEKAVPVQMACILCVASLFLSLSKSYNFDVSTIQGLVIQRLLGEGAGQVGLHRKD